MNIADNAENQLVQINKTIWNTRNIIRGSVDSEQYVVLLYLLSVYRKQCSTYICVEDIS